MTTQQFFKGLLMAVVGVIVVAFSTTPIDYLLLAITAACTILSYTGKNLIAVLHSDSPAGSLSLVNLISGVLVALGTGILQYVGQFLIAGVLEWDILWKVVASVFFTYLGTTFFAPPYNAGSVKGFAGKAYISKYQKGLIIIFFLLVPIAVSAQGPFDGFLKKKTGTPVDVRLRAEGDKTFQWFFRPAATLTAVQFTWNKETKTFNSSTFSSAGVGLGFQHYVEHSGELVNNYGFNALLMLDGSQAESGMAVAGTVNALQFVNIGGGYNITGKQWFLLLGGVYNF